MDNDACDTNHKKDGLLIRDKDPNRVFGHIHMAKTGGTTLNGELALNYERVCGHKGWSYDAYLVNERVKEVTSIEKKDWREVKDSYSFAHQAKTKRRALPFSRGRVPLWIGDEVGYHDCDYISEERGWGFWKQFDDFHNTTMELHVPCRDPISHLMSMCNHRMKIFDCKNPDYRAEAKKCFVDVKNRFSRKLLYMKNTDIRCYDFNNQFQGYMEYITPMLQKKRIQSNYMHRDSNIKTRNKENECIWKEPNLQKRVSLFLSETIEYYSFCKECLGSSDDLLHQNV